jgi:hypothetical protein
MRKRQLRRFIEVQPVAVRSAVPECLEHAPKARLGNGLANGSKDPAHERNAACDAESRQRFFANIGKA